MILKSSIAPLVARQLELEASSRTIPVQSEEARTGSSQFEQVRTSVNRFEPVRTTTKNSKETEGQDVEDTKPTDLEGKITDLQQKLKEAEIEKKDLKRKLADAEVEKEVQSKFRSMIEDDRKILLDQVSKISRELGTAEAMVQQLQLEAPPPVSNARDAEVVHSVYDHDVEPAPPEPDHPDEQFDDYGGEGDMFEPPSADPEPREQSVAGNVEPDHMPSTPDYTAQYRANDATH